jgi:chromosome segregation ATPase
MVEADILSDLISSNPNEPARNGALLLLRAEMKSEFKIIRSDLALLTGRMDGFESRMDGLGSRMDKLESRMDGLESRMDKLESRMGRLESLMTSANASLELIAQQVAFLVSRTS